MRTFHTGGVAGDDITTGLPRVEELFEARKPKGVYRIVDKSDPENPRVTDDVVYLAADEEDNYYIAQANTPLDEEGHFATQNVTGRFKDDITSQFDKEIIDLMDVPDRKLNPPFCLYVFRRELKYSRQRNKCENSIFRHIRFDSYSRVL